MAVWTCGPVALWPGWGAKRGPSFRESRQVPLSPASASYSAPARQSAAAAAKATAAVT